MTSFLLKGPYGLRNTVFIRHLDTLYLLCWPVLNPQITGDPTLLGAVTENVSVKQSPIESAFVDTAAEVRATAVPTSGLAMLNVIKFNLKRQTSELCLQMR